MNHAKPLSEFDIISQNLRGSGGSKDGHYKLNAMAAMSNTSTKHEIRLIQETKMPNNETLQINGNTFFLCGHDQREQRAGIGIMLSKKATQAWEQSGCPQPIRAHCASAGRVIALPISIQAKELLLISLHFPHSDKSEYSNE